MATLGSDSAPDIVIAPGAQVHQAAALLEFPADAHVLELGAYLRALAGFGPVNYRLCLWRWDGHVGDANKLLGQSALHTAGAAAATPDQMVRVTWPLETPVDLPAYTDVLVGVAWDTNPELQMMLGGYSGTGVRYRRDTADGSTWPVSMKDSVRLTDHNQAAWVEEWAPQSGVWVYRSGDWHRLDDGGVAVERGGGAVNAEVRVRRSGVWVLVARSGL